MNKASNHRQRLFLGLTLGLCFFLSSVALAKSPSSKPSKPPSSASSKPKASKKKPYPKDPFAWEYAPPKAKEVGTTTQQLRLSLNGGLQLNKSPQLLFQGTAEFMTYAFLGVRISTLFTLHRFSGEDGPTLLTWRVGPSLHVLPYRRVDLSFFFEAGPQVSNPLKEGGNHWHPAITGGINFTISINSYWFIHFEGQLSWGVFERSGKAETYTGANAFLGVGLQI